MPVDFNLYLITDRKLVKSGNLPGTVEQALQGGVKAVQLREKDLCSRDLYTLALQLRALTRQFSARLLINDRIDIARAVDADGVHLPENGIPADQARKLLDPSRLIGVSCHTLEGALAAELAGADFITFGPVFATPSKALYGDPAGLAQLGAVASALSIPVFGLGGIKLANLHSVISAGTAGVAVISEIIAAEDPTAAARATLALLDCTRKELIP